MKIEDLNIQSYCFRKFDNATTTQMVRELGLSGIEICGVHADFHDHAGWKEVLKVYHDQGLKVVSIGVETFDGADSERDIFEAAAIAGAGHVSAHFRVDSFTRAIPKVRKWCQEFSLKVGIHCHGGYMFGGSPDVLSHLIALGQPEIGLMIDTAWAMQIGPGRGNPVEWVETFGEHISAIHYKDFTFASNGQWKDTVVGEGNLDLRAFNAALKRKNLHPLSIIEYEADPDNPVPALKNCLAKMLEA